LFLSILNVDDDNGNDREKKAEALKHSKKNPVQCLAADDANDGVGSTPSHQTNYSKYGNDSPIQGEF